MPSFGHFVMFSDTKSYAVPHVGQTMWRWRSPAWDSADYAGRSGLHGPAGPGPVGRGETGTRKNPATHTPAAP